MNEADGTYIPVEEFKIFKNYIVESYGHKCEDFAAGCVACFIWAAMDVIEDFIEWQTVEDSPEPNTVTYDQIDPED